MAKFEARVFIQGVANYVPHVDGTRMLALFPDTEYRVTKRVRDARGKKIQLHYAVVQAHENVLTAGTEMGDWRSTTVSDQWLSFESDSTQAFAIAAGGLGVPNIEDVLENDGLSNYKELDSRALPGSKHAKALLKGGVVINSGVVSPDSDYMGGWEFRRGKGGGMKFFGSYSSVIKIELGLVSRFELKALPFNSNKASSIPLAPDGDELDVWIRHFDNVQEKPSPECGSANKEPDLDFALNYALRSNFEGMLVERKNRELPYPRVRKSWKGGDPIGGDPCRCMGCNQNAVNF